MLSAPVSRFLKFFLYVPILSTVGVAASPDLSAAWADLADSQPNRVLHRLGSHQESRPAKLAWAAARMSAQPATDDDLRAAETVLADLAKGDDDVAAEAGYLRARLYQLHFAQPDYAKAAKYFAELAAHQPQSHWAQLGLVKLGMLKLYVLPDDTAPGADRLAPAEALLSKIHEPLLQRDLHLQIGQAGVLLKQPLQRLLPHLVAADRIGGITGTAHEDLVVQIGVLSLRAGQPAQAKDYFEQYLREFPENLRAFAIRLKLDQAKQQLAKESAR